MKKIVLIMLASIIMILVYQNSKKDYFVIPDEAIRFRIIANSDSIQDQYIKSKVKDGIEPTINEVINDKSNLVETRENLMNNLNLIEDSIQRTMKKYEFNQKFSINYGLNYFPKKEYRGLIYEEGDYESLVITLGEGKGDNWWCVLFPPVCFVDMNESEDIEYKLFITEIFDKFK